MGVTYTVRQKYNMALGEGMHMYYVFLLRKINLEILGFAWVAYIYNLNYSGC